jgi:hypothetical protein
MPGITEDPAASIRGALREAGSSKTCSGPPTETIRPPATSTEPVKDVLLSMSQIRAFSIKMVPIPLGIVIRPLLHGKDLDPRIKAAVKSINLLRSPKIVVPLRHTI